MAFEGYTLHLELDLYPAGSLLRESPTLATQLRRPKNLADWISSQHKSLDMAGVNSANVALSVFEERNRLNRIKDLLLVITESGVHPRRSISPT
jgi:hypothetical protein